MKKYKVVLSLMVNPSKGDETFEQSYNVEAINESDAYSEAITKQSNDTEEISYRSIFNYSVTEI